VPVRPGKVAHRAKWTLPTVGANQYYSNMRSTNSPGADGQAHPDGSSGTAGGSSVLVGPSDPGRGVAGGDGRAAKTASSSSALLPSGVRLEVWPRRVQRSSLAAGTSGAGSSRGSGPSGRWTQPDRRTQPDLRARLDRRAQPEPRVQPDPREQSAARPSLRMVAGERPHRPSPTGERLSRPSPAGSSLLVVPSALVVARAASGLSWREARRQVLDALVDEVEAADRAIAIAQARRIRAIEAVRVEAVGAVAALDPVLGPVDPADAVRISDIQAQQGYAHQSVVLEVSCAIRAPEVSTASLVHDAQVLVDHHPATLAALTDGSISYAHVGVVLENTTLLEPDDCRALEVALVDRAKDTTVAALRRFARRERERTHPRPLIERYGERLAERHVEIEPARDGMMWLHQYLPAVQAAAIYNRVTDIELPGPGRRAHPRSAPRRRPERTAPR